MPKLSDAQLDVVPGATGERRSNGQLCGDRLRAALRGDPCIIPADEGDPRRLARTETGQYVDPHEWKAVPGHPGWLKCTRCPTVMRVEELVAADERYAASRGRR